MATEEKLNCISREAAADLSGKQFYIVYIDSNGKADLSSAVTSKSVGILQNKPTAGQPASIAIGGVSKIVGGAALTVGQVIASDSAGKGTAITVAAGGTVYNYAVGEVVEASGAAGGIASVLISPATTGPRLV